MTPAAATDVLLALTCALLLWRQGRAAPGLSVALSGIALAACFGVARFSGLAAAAGPHQFFSLLGAVAAVPLLAWCLWAPSSLPALQPRAAALVIIFGGAGGVVLVGVLKLKIWGLLMLLSAVLLLVRAAWQRRSMSFWAGTVLLVLGGVVQAAQPVLGSWPAVAWLHLLLSAGLAWLLWPRVSQSGST